jgi:hypothetical protein
VRVLRVVKRGLERPQQFDAQFPTLAFSTFGKPTFTWASGQRIVVIEKSGLSRSFLHSSSHSSELCHHQVTLTNRTRYPNQWYVMSGLLQDCREAFRSFDQMVDGESVTGETPPALPARQTDSLTASRPDDRQEKRAISLDPF